MRAYSHIFLSKDFNKKYFFVFIELLNEQCFLKDYYKRDVVKTYFSYNKKVFLFFWYMKAKLDMEFGTNFTRTEGVDTEFTPQYSVNYILFKEEEKCFTPILL